MAPIFIEVQNRPCKEPLGNLDGLPKPTIAGEKMQKEGFFNENEGNAAVNEPFANNLTLNARGGLMMISS